MRRNAGEILQKLIDPKVPHGKPNGQSHHFHTAIAGKTVVIYGQWIGMEPRLEPGKRSRPFDLMEFQRKEMVFGAPTSPAGPGCASKGSILHLSQCRLCEDGFHRIDLPLLQGEALGVDDRIHRQRGTSKMQGGSP
jgi:hypothetical protein